MRITEGYWLRSERASASFAMQAYRVDALPNGLRVVAPERIVHDRAGTLNLATLTLEFTPAGPDAIAVRCVHHQGYQSGEPRFETLPQPAVAVSVEQDETEARMTAGNMTVRVNKESWGFSFEWKGRPLTDSGFRNLAYVRWNRQPSTMLPEENYLSDRFAPHMLCELSLAFDECVYGLGERFTAFVKNGQTVEMWNEDGGSSSQIAYKNVPLYLTNKSYGVLVDHSGPVSFEVASEKVEYVGFSVPGEELRYYVIGGENPGEVLQNYTGLTGRSALPPAWSFGLWLSTSFTTEYDEATTTSFIEGMEQREIPFSVFHYDCFWMRELQWCDFTWDEQIFPDVEGMLRRNHERGLKVCVWVNPYIAQGTDAFAEGLREGYFLQRADGRGPRQLDHWQPGMALVDFSNPAAAAWYTEKLRGLLRMGVDCFKTDFGERIPTDVAYHNGADPVAMHNYYTYLYNQCVFRLLEEERGKGEAVLFARSATAGSQQFPLHWGGDNSASYPSMAETLRGGLSLAMGGFAFWSHDIGGFEQTSTPDLYKRWVQFGMLSTHSRLHGSTSSRVPWNFDEEASEVLRRFARLKCRLMPYLYSAAVAAQQTGLPVMRPMVLEFCGDPAVDALDRQYMLGGRLLVAPVFTAEGRVSYYLPEGVWTHLLTGEERVGGRWYTETYDYFSLPLFVRENTLLPIGSCETRPDYDYAAGTTWRLYALQEGTSAEATLVDTTGATLVQATATRAEGSITLHFSSPLPSAASLCLVGVAEASANGEKLKKGQEGAELALPAGTEALQIQIQATC